MTQISELLYHSITHISIALNEDYFLKQPTLHMTQRHEIYSEAITLNGFNKNSIGNICFVYLKFCAKDTFNN